MVILLPIALYGLAKVYVHYRVTSGLDELVAKAAPVAKIRYGDVESSLSGKLTINKIEATHEASGFYLRVRSLDLQGDGFGFLLDLAGGLEKNEMPAKLSARFRGLVFPIDEELFSALLMTADPASGGMKKTCTLAGLLQRSELMELGYSSINADVGFGYEFEPDAKTLEARFDYDMKGVDSFALDIRMSGLPDQAAGMMTSQPVIEHAGLQFSVEPEYMQRAIQYCADKKKLNREAFISSLFSESDAYYQYNLGFVPGLGLRSLFEELVTRGGTVEVQIAWPSDLPMQQVATLPPEAVVAMLVKQVSINGKLVTDLSLSQMDITGMEFDDEMLDVEAVRWAEEQRRKKRRWSFQQVSKRELSSHLGRQVRLYVQGQSKPRVGELDEVTSSEVLVDQRRRKGTITAHVPLSQLVRAEVYLPEPPKTPAQ
jgi:hypothetical protein